ncbi:MAG: hypothetical protein QOG15_1070 [Solirubrobacteraceae bacterium]|jgi:hypothetical protein|nr:hypothetical protein [Solirubrobacteraceae bacterium]
MNFGPVLDWGRANFIVLVAAALPLAGLVIAIVRFAEGERQEGARILAAAVLGALVYLILLS